MTSAARKSGARSSSRSARVPATFSRPGGDRIADVIRLGGMQPARRADKVLESARLVHELYDDDLRRVLRLPLAQVRRELQRFPGIGAPGADKVLLFTRTQPVLALESNGLRVLLRLGFGKEDKNYAAAYKSVQAALANELQTDFDWLIAAHELLRRHGQTLCRRNEPVCGDCPLRTGCPAGRHWRAVRRPARERGL